MYYLILGCCSLVFAALPIRLTPLGRILAAYNGGACLTYGFVLTGVLNPTIFGGLFYFYSVDGSPWTVQGVTATASLALAVFAGLYRRQDVRSLSGSALGISIPPSISLAIIAASTLALAFLVLEIGTDTLASYTEYGSIKNGIHRFAGNTLGRLIFGMHRPLAILVLVSAVLNWASGRRALSLLALIPISLAFALGIAEASRISALYLMVAAACFYLTDRKGIALACTAVAFSAIGYSLEARSHALQGWSYAGEYFLNALSFDSLITSVTNFSGGLLITSAAGDLAAPNNYEFVYKYLSFLPSTGSLDGFQSVLATNQQRVSFAIPFSSPGEAWAFGLVYYVLMWGIMVAAVIAVNGSIRQSRLLYAVLLSAFVLGWMYAAQYPVRNSIRYFYAVIAMRFIGGWLMNKMQERKLLTQRPRRPRRAVPGPSQSPSPLLNKSS